MPSRGATDRLMREIWSPGREPLPVQPAETSAIWLRRCGPALPTGPKPQEQGPGGYHRRGRHRSGQPAPVSAREISDEAHDEGENNPNRQPSSRLGHSPLSSHSVSISVGLREKRSVVDLSCSHTSRRPASRGHGRAAPRGGGQREQTCPYPSARRLRFEGGQLSQMMSRTDRVFVSSVAVGVGRTAVSVFGKGPRRRSTPGCASKTKPASR